MSSYRPASSSSANEYSRSATPHAVAGSTRVQRGSAFACSPAAGSFSASSTSTRSSKQGRSTHFLKPAECDLMCPARTAVSSRKSEARSLSTVRRPAKGAMERVSEGDKSPRSRRRCSLVRCMVDSRLSA